MGKSLYRSLAKDSFRKHKESFLPFVFSSILMVLMFHLVYALSISEELSPFYGIDSIQTILGLAAGVVGVFSLIFLYYTNSALMRRRKKEFALFNILGMEKSHIRKILLWENIYSWLISVTGGFILSTAIYKLSQGLLFRLIQVPISGSFIPLPKSYLLTFILFTGIYILIFLNSLRQLHFSTPASLMEEAKAGEKPPKANPLLILVGLLSLGGGYYIALTIKSPMKALGFFFLAVILVMIGTYCLFVSFSVAVLNFLKKRKKFYYKKNRFVAIGGLRFRMRQNGVGLASICILSTAVLILLSSAFCLYLGAKDVINGFYPREFIFRTTELENTKLDQFVEQNTKNVEKKDYISLDYTSTLGKEEGNSLRILTEDVSMKDVETNRLYMIFTPYNDRAKVQGVELKEGEILLYDPEGKIQMDRIVIGKKTYEVKTVQERFPDEALVKDGYYQNHVFALPEMKDVLEIEESIQYLDGYRFTNDEKHVVAFDTNLTGKEQFDLYQSISDIRKEEGFTFHFRSKANEMDTYIRFFGAVFFVGIFLAIVFFVSVTLTIYYKQLSEGYEDAKRYGVMRRVGMTKKEIRKSIGTQILFVFFLPLIMAGIHIAFAYPITITLLGTTGFTQGSLFVKSFVFVYIAFAAVYFIIYMTTSKVYYKLVTKADSTEIVL